MKQEATAVNECKGSTDGGYGIIVIDGIKTVSTYPMARAFGRSEERKKLLVYDASILFEKNTVKNCEIP